MKAKGLWKLGVMAAVGVAWSRAFGTEGTEAYVFVKKWRTNGSGEGEFSTPTGVAVDPADGGGNVYVADPLNCRIQKFRRDLGPTFAVDELAHGPAGLTVVWVSAPGRTYQIWQTADLAAWQALPTVVESQGDSTSWTDNTTSEVRQRFYKIELLP